MAIEKQLVVKYYPVAPLMLGGDLYHIYSYILSTKKVRQRSTQKVDTGAVHQLLILDRSGSMYADVNEMIDQAKSIFSQSRPGDFFSILWFSSPGDFQVLLKGAQYNTKLGSLLDTIRSVRGTTCFSDPIRETAKTIDELSTIADNVVVTLLSDGVPIVDDVKKEVNLCQSLVAGMRKKIIAFNTIGFGNYYNRDFMQLLSSCSEQGRYVHISKIREFEPVYRETAERVRDLTNCPLTITAPNAQIMYQSGKTVILKEDGTLELEHVNLDDNRITIFVPDRQFSDGGITFGDEESSFFHSVAITSEGKVSTRWHLCDGLNFSEEKPAPISYDILYAYASVLYKNKKTKRSREIVVRNIGDKPLADKITSAFTYAEMGEASALFDNMIVDEGARNLGSCDASYIPVRDALCVMDVLGMLTGSPNNLYIPFAYKSSMEGLSEGQTLARNLLKPYHRVREKTIDSQDIFYASPDEVQVRCTDLIYAEDRPNISLRFTIPGVAKLNSRAASRVGLPEDYRVSRYVTHTFIKDGNLNIPHAEFVLDQSTYNYMITRDVPHTIINEDERRAIIHLEKMPIINEAIMENSLLSLPEIARKIKKSIEDEALQKVLHNYIKTLRDTMGVVSESLEDFSLLSEDQIQVLLDHGIDKRSVYSGISKERVERTDTSDYYMVREISMYPAGISSLPSVSSVLKKIEEKKKLTLREESIATAVSSLEAIVNNSHIYDTKKLEVLDNLLALCKNRLARHRNELAKFKIALCLNSDFEVFSGLDFEEKTKTATFEGVCIKLDKVRQYV